MMDWGHGYGYGAGGWILMTLIMLAFWALVVVGIIAIFRGSRGGTSAPPTSSAPSDLRREPDAQHILDERFARGEIDETEYQSRKNALANR